LTTEKLPVATLSIFLLDFPLLNPFNVSVIKTSMTLRSVCIFFYVWSSVSLIAQPKSTTQTLGSEKSAMQLRDDWMMQSSCKVETTGEFISTAKFQPSGWQSVSVPTTVVGALVKLKVYPDPEFGVNLRKFPGMNYPIGENFSNFPMHQDSPFMVPWWFRKEFTLPESYKGKTIWLNFAELIIARTFS